MVSRGRELLMSVAQLATQYAAASRNGYPSDGSKPLPRRLERLCSLSASEEYKISQIASLVKVSERTVYAMRARPLVRARIAYLREQLRASAYDAAPLVDKRNRVVMANDLAQALHSEGERKGWRDTVAVTKQGEEITGFDWRRTDQLRMLLDYIAKEVGDRTAPAASTTTVNVGISMEDAAVRVQALLSRLPDVIEGEAEEVRGVSPSEGGVGGSTEGRIG